MHGPSVSSCGKYLLVYFHFNFYYGVLWCTKFNLYILYINIFICAYKYIYILFNLYIYIIFLYNFFYSFYVYKDLTAPTLNQKILALVKKKHLKFRRKKARSLIQQKKWAVFILETSGTEIWDYGVINNTDWIP